MACLLRFTHGGVDPSITYLLFTKLRRWSTMRWTPYRHTIHESAYPTRRFNNASITRCDDIFVLRERQTCRHLAHRDRKTNRGHVEYITATCDTQKTTAVRGQFRQMCKRFTQTTRADWFTSYFRSTTRLSPNNGFPTILTETKKNKSSKMASIPLQRPRGGHSISSGGSMNAASRNTTDYWHKIRVF